MDPEEWVGLGHMTNGNLCSPSRGRDSTATAGAVEKNTCRKQNSGQ